MENAKDLKTPRKSSDDIDAEMEAWLDNTDLTKVPGFGKGRWFDPKTRSFSQGRPRIGKRFNVTLPDELIEQLKAAAAKRGVGYQTLVRIIVSEKISEYQ